MAIIFLGLVSSAVVVVSSLVMLVQTASLAFYESKWRDWLALLGALGAAGAAVIVTGHLAHQHPWVFAGLVFAADFTSCSI